MCVYFFLKMIKPSCTFFLAAFLALLNCAQDAQCEQELPLDQQLLQAAPWIIYFEANIHRPYLVYPGSTMYNPLVLSVTYRKRDENSQLEPIQRYEDLWYKNGKAIGLRRFSNLAVRQDGVIYVKPSQHLRDNPNAPKAVGNAIARVVLDVVTSTANGLGANLRTAYVPKDIFEETISELSNLGFSKITTGSVGRTLTIHLASYPASTEVYLRHRNMVSYE